MATQATRKAAEQAALEALGGRVAAIGDLGLAAARRADAADGPARAKARTAELLAAARAEGRALTDAAVEEIAAADDDYAARRAAAVDAGWTEQELAALNYPPLSRRRRTSPSTPTAAPTGRPTSADSRLPTQDIPATDSAETSA
ncbi:hypothetical protein CcI156_09250 [Frankia sp. CcI156]|uniref:Uncharacterized protein n=1 Tax=Frankia casuarinae (strain DSM 45818 / CECT 9043 / HFP020203 / CcI3) TaxID=106370 RepID=Q2JAH2_FRACC|nr:MULTISPECIES: hypothetical protein [Frankia]ABD11720.1 hypothetical protein Francci3_2353 [Frankia casuarinae]ETA03445.1 hypothetical protein CcI6DRAFT_01161 [Frankia sp. CcI6]EYT93221.1 hypothetical protein ThrDRAFT_01191 [Frankia casuarinae]OAA26790.1 hypothetical protein AAY23_102736 [Frankia casuarinae]OHV56287.1 hypothetical protein CgIS1_09225 [Frankia sp. CgIS1]